MDESTAIAAFVGKKSAYYTRVWQCEDSEPRPRLSVNIAAVIFGLFWLAYRKLYTPLAAVIGIMLADGLSISALENTGMVPAVIIDTWDLVAPLVYAAVLGGFGNRWYWNKYQKAAANARSASPDPILQEAFLRERGGTSPLSALALLAVAIGLIALAITAFGL